MAATTRPSIDRPIPANSSAFPGMPLTRTDPLGALYRFALQTAFPAAPASPLVTEEMSCAAREHLSRFLSSLARIGRASRSMPPCRAPSAMVVA